MTTRTTTFSMGVSVSQLYSIVSVPDVMSLVLVVIQLLKSSERVGTGYMSDSIIRRMVLTLSSFLPCCPYPFLALEPTLTGSYSLYQTQGDYDFSSRTLSASSVKTLVVLLRCYLSVSTTLQPYSRRLVTLSGD